MIFMAAPSAKNDRIDAHRTFNDETRKSATVIKTTKSEFEIRIRKIQAKFHPESGDTKNQIKMVIGLAREEALLEKKCAMWNPHIVSKEILSPDPRACAQQAVQPC